MWKNKRFLTVLLAAGMMLAGCQTIEEDLTPETSETKENEGVYTITVKAHKGSGTKALSLSTEGNTLNAGWKSGEQVRILRDGENIGELNVTTASDAFSTEATLAGSVHANIISQDQILTLLFPRASWDYTGQKGILSGEGSVESQYDYAMTTLTVISKDHVHSSLVTTPEVVFENQQSVYRFSFKVGENALSVKQCAVGAVSGKLMQKLSYDTGTNSWVSTPGSITVTTSAATTNPLYVALRNELAGTPTPEQIAAKTTLDTYSFTVIDNNGFCYLGEKPIPASALNMHGRFIDAPDITVTRLGVTSSSVTKSEVW